MRSEQPGDAAYAQTNLSLYADLVARGISDDDLLRVHAAYHLSTRLFANRFRADGRPFVTHLLGTAAVTAAHGGAIASDTDAILAGLLHAAYDQGEFGDRLARSAEEHRRLLRRAIGDSAEKLVYDYCKTPWPPKDPAAIVARIEKGEVSDDEKRMLALRAANEYDDVRDLAPLFYAESKGDVVDAGCTAAIAIARALGLDDLAAVIERAVERNRTASVPAGLRSKRGGSYTVEPVRLRERITRAILRKGPTR